MKRCTHRFKRFELYWRARQPELSQITCGFEANSRAINSESRSAPIIADLIALGMVALANPDFPKRLAANQLFDEFDTSILGPSANIKDTELAC